MNTDCKVISSCIKKEKKEEKHKRKYTLVKTDLCIPDYVLYLYIK